MAPAAGQMSRQNFVTAAICLASAAFILVMIKGSHLGKPSTISASAQSLQIPGDHFSQLCASILRSTLAPQQQSVTTVEEVIKKSLALADRLLEVQEPAGLEPRNTVTASFLKVQEPAGLKSLNTVTASVLDKLIFRKSSAQKRFGNITLTGLVFFGSGRKQRQRIVQCYIERNLVSNGGLLSEVIWKIRETSSPEDFAFLQEILDRQPKYYRKVVVKMDGDNTRFQNYYTDIDPSRYYVKLDDDIVWVADGAIEAMLEEKLRGRFLYLSANVINHSILALMHARMGVLNGYVPSGPGLPWHKLGNTSFLDGSPAARVEGEPFGNGWSSWEIAAVQHYNFFAHHKAGTLEEYKQTSIYDFHARGYDRWSISFIIFKGSELGIFEHGEDELLISKDFPEAAGKHCGAVPKALVAHYSYNIQFDGLSSQPDILSAYGAIAEATCGSLVGHE